MDQLAGIHHLTAITADAAANRAFYTQTLGLRLVKKTVNQDDTSAYHLFYADARATPGTDLTFFDWPTGRERRGTRAITRTGLRVGGKADLDWWKAHLTEARVRHGAITEIDGRLSLDLEDPEGQRLRLVAEGDAGPSHPWDRSPVPAAHQIRGLGPITISLPDLGQTGVLLTRVLNMAQIRDYTAPGTGNRVHVFAMGPGGPGAELHVVIEPSLRPAGQGAGGAHHLAFRAPDPAALRAWTERLRSFAIANSGEVERFYFRSLYFREPGGVLFEIATDGPGFTADEPLETLGERLSLPPFLEARREKIEAGLKPLD